ncbi:hypothetical protein ACIGW7_19080 [Streptomyces sp. NPDC053253]|uniref:hypothetical protein n=1 Tax=Streptomyces sp. NPDC053253 TaxID=3365699 RepID=UPI0037D0848E
MEAVFDDVELLASRTGEDRIMAGDVVQGGPLDLLRVPQAEGEPALIAVGTVGAVLARPVARKSGGDCKGEGVEGC